MAPLATTKFQGIAVRERACFNCNGKMTSQGVKNGLYLYYCNACNNSFEVYEPK